MHRKLHAGSIIRMSVANMNMAAGGAAVPNLSPEFMRYPATTYNLGRPVAGHGTDPAYEPVAPGLDHNNARNLVWLPYVPGLITLVPYTGVMSICTGWMSGCWLALVQIGGVDHFAHIGTLDSATDPATLAVKNAFKVAVGTGALTVSQAFQPICPTSPSTMGVVSTRRNFYTFGMSSSHVSFGPMNLRVDSKTPSPSQASLPQYF